MKRRLITVAVLAAALVTAPAAVSAHSTVHVSGVYAVTDLGTLDCVLGGSPFVLHCTTTGLVSEYSGSLSGTSVSNFEQTIDCKTARVHGQGTETFTGPVSGIGTGSLTWMIRFDAAFDCSTFSVSDFYGTGVIVSGTDALAGLHGTLEFVDVTYDGGLR